MSSLTMAARAWLKQFPALVAAKRRLTRIRHGYDARICEDLPLYTPYSSGSYRDRARLTLQAANEVFPLLARLTGSLGNPRLPVVDARDFPGDSAGMDAALRLKEHLDRNGSNKATRHNYHLVYGPILKDTARVTAVLEVGLGTNNTDVVSNMGSEGRPGASVRAFRDFLPAAWIYGADVDKRILFEEPRIKTFFADQTDPRTFEEIGRQVAEKMDLIIDDGLHSPSANVTVLDFAVGRLKPGGWVVIEDIAASALPMWEVVASLLHPGYRCKLIKAAGGWVFVAQADTAVDGAVAAP